MQIKPLRIGGGMKEIKILRVFAHTQTCVEQKKCLIFAPYYEKRILIS